MTAHMPSFSRTWSAPVPKDSSPQMKGVYFGLPGKYLGSPLSMRLPKNFQPVGTSKQSMPFSFATMSSAPEVGMERAHPFRPSLNCGMRSAFATIIARESEGEQKNFEDMIMLRSASPSAAAPKLGGGAAVSILLPDLSRPMV